jgi:hypothetical protein
MPLVHEPAIHTAENATTQELRRAALRLLAMLVLLAILVVPFLMLFPAGETTRIGLLAWLLVALAFYWLYAGMGYQAVLLLQLLTFSAAATLLTTKAALVLVGIGQVAVLRYSARVLVILGTLMALGNLGSMWLALRRRNT